MSNKFRKMIFLIRKLKVFIHMTKRIIILFLLLLNIQVFSQEKFWVFFTDKKDVQFNPYEYFDAKAIERRIKNNLSLQDSTDFPLNTDYVQKIKELIDSVSTYTRWFNGMLVYADTVQIQKINKLSFVRKVQVVPHRYFALASLTRFSEKTVEHLRKQQIASFQGEYFINKNINGKGIRIAVFDGGFKNVDTHPAFKYLRDNHKIIATYDFTKNKEFVYGYIAHGREVLSNIAGLYNGKPLGLATEAEFLLARTEIAAEPLAEEEYWLAAVEWADKNGADIINSSLGYTNQRYFNYQMDGTSLVARAGNLAAKKGILVVNAAGNEGDLSYWKYIGTPADADSVLTVGGIDPETSYHMSFASYGPTADGRRKPNVSAFAYATVADEKDLTTAYGTSFACPLTTGFAACVLQIHKEYTAMQLFHEIEKSAYLYPYYDYAHGYGIPQASYFFKESKKQTIASFRVSLSKGILEVEMLNPVSCSLKKNYMYYHISDKNGKLKEYKLIEVYQKKVLELNLDKYSKTDVLRIHYKGYTYETTLSSLEK